MYGRSYHTRSRLERSRCVWAICRPVWAFRPFFYSLWGLAWVPRWYGAWGEGVRPEIHRFGWTGGVVSLIFSVTSLSDIE